jgi:hypothetical protein
MNGNGVSKTILGLILGLLLGLLLCAFIYLSYNEGSSTIVDDFFKFVPKILYINLDKRPDRNDEFLSNFNESREIHDHVERVQAIYEDGNGHLGCLKSHIKALKRSLELDYSHILIAEDDFCVKDINYANESLEKFFDNFDEWDVLMLGQNTFLSEDTNTPGVIKIISSQTTSGYLIKKDYIPKLLHIYERDLKKYEDSGLWSPSYCTDQSWTELQKIDKWYSFRDSVGFQRSSYSDIEKKFVDYAV